MEAIISIIDELYNTLHIPCVIFDQEYHLIHPKITMINLKEFLDDVFTMTHHDVHILVYDHSVAYARLQINFAKKTYFFITACILNDIENTDQCLPESWTQIIPEHLIRSHIANLHFMSFQNHVKMIYEIVTHQVLSLNQIHIDYVNKNQKSKENDVLTNRRITQNTPDYYHWEQMLLNAYKQGHFHTIKELFSEIKQYEYFPLSPDILEDQKYKYIGLVTILTRINIQEGVSSELAFTLSDQMIQKITQAHQYRDTSSLFYQTLQDFYHQLNEAKKMNYSLHIYKCIHYIDTHLYDKISLHHLAEYTGLSSSYLSLAFKQEMNETVTSYIQRKKADEAARLLLFTNKSHIDISCLLNFSSQSNFIQVFKKYKHMTPKQYQDSHLKDQ
ncbi:helix-turn-helix domain-containing protein [Candidatus Stoquefichus massiliensis]|uniref:helix-turn-helix domain-containing protein n=1 Tax=Candidatus Stoquefichus massiliensis TaxID=1470350 RepID=UPI000482A2ED|nr:helix-turn-helix domain-containing protein [Candidatus Stoquefichus massiliensis]